MALILNIETSTKTCSVNLSKNGKSLGVNEITSEKYVHGEKLHLLIKDLFASLNLSLKTAGCSWCQRWTWVFYWP